MVATHRLRTAVPEGAYKQPSCRMRAAGYSRLPRKRWLHLSFQRLPLWENIEMHGKGRVTGRNAVM